MRSAYGSQLQADQYRVGQQVRDEMTCNLMEAKLQLEDPPVEIVVVETGVPPTAGLSLAGSQCCRCRSDRHRRGIVLCPHLWAIWPD